MPSADFCPAVRRPLGLLSRRNGDTRQISRGKLNRLRCTTAGSTLRAVDGYGLRDTLPARPALAPRIRCQRHDAEDERKRGHKDRPEPRARRLHGGIEPVLALILGLARE